MPENKDILYVAYHYPPILGSSGVHRTLAFTRHLSENGWQVRILTSSLKAYRNWSPEQQAFIPKGTKVIRAFAREAARHFSWKGKYWGAMALPDNWQSWIVGGVVSGLWTILKRKPGVIVSTYPIASAHFIGYFLHKLTGVPWVADLRDPMAQADYPSDKRLRKWFKWIEAKIIKHCRYAIVTAPGAKEFYMQQYPETSNDFWQVLPNGFDSKIFDELTSEVQDKQSEKGENHKITLLHSGVIYPSERDPRHFFKAIAELIEENEISVDNFEVRLRATGNDNLFAPQLKTLGIDSVVKLLPTVPYKQALSEMFEVDALLLLQAANCDYQIPAKAYEYIRVQKPVLGLTSIAGDTGKLLSRVGIAEIAELDNMEHIKAAIMAIVKKVQSHEQPEIDPELVSSYSRQHQAIQLEELLLGIE